ncbi:hypothetical protein FSP39_005550 [Pinctada imbricata]|uniref:Mab-21-like HhH/H2TH-like domain-containing protein n=1 Tax=Pinctada imbricata TaxID=66713 RepID=A0AA88XQA0_PINIB|nr:hypothetical protein FSP39_005550 [Pinctada imbricata]
MDIASRLSYLFGSEEEVCTRRQLALFREKLLSYSLTGDEDSVICSGSLGEGIAYPSSDDDLMITWGCPNVVKTYQDAETENDVIMIPSKYCPGYCILFNVKLSELHGRAVVFPTASWLRCQLRGNNFIHGPCVSRVYGIFEYDFGKCLPCKFWPNVASNWVTRNRVYGWPSHEMIQTIISRCCHLMAIGDPNSPDCDVEWRVSFSVAERSLMHSFNHTQFLTYNLLRISLKRIIEKHLPGVFCSYFMKTALYYTIENTSFQHWDLNNIERCFKSCLITLIDFIDSMNCPNYFIPEYNIFKNKINRGNRQSALTIIRTLNNVGVVGVLRLSGEERCLNEALSLPFIEWKSDIDFMRSWNLDLLLELIEKSSGEEIGKPLCTSSFLEILTVLSKNANIIQTKLLKVIIRRAIICCSKKSLQYFGISTKSNKRNYPSYQKLETLIRLGYRGDVTTGKLTAATYMFMIGRTESALSVIRQLFSEYPPYAMECDCDHFKRAIYMEVMCSKQYTIDYKTRHSWAPTYQLPSGIEHAYPLPLRLWIANEESLILEPCTYAIVLECLCYVQLKKSRQLLRSTRYLIQHIHDLKHGDDIVHGKFCAGIVMSAQDKYQSTCRWFCSAYRLKDQLPRPFNDTLASSVSLYIACMINKSNGQFND